MPKVNNSSTGVAAVDRALSILDAFRENDETELSLAAIASTTGLYKSTILRLIGSLEKGGYIRQIENGKYKLGRAVYELGSIYHNSFNLEELVKPVLEKIVKQIGESCSFLILEREHQLILYRVNTTNRVRDTLGKGDTMPLSEGGASAKVMRLYAEMNSGSVSVSSMAQFSFGERNSEMAGVAVPIFGENNRFFGALSVTGPRYRITEEAARTIGETLCREAVALSSELGASDDLFIHSEAA